MKTIGKATITGFLLLFLTALLGIPNGVLPVPDLRAEDKPAGDKILQNQVNPGMVKSMDTIGPLQLKNIQLLSSRVTLQPIEQQQLDSATKLLVNQNYADTVNRSLSVQPRVTVLGRVGNKLQVEALVVFLAKDTYTAKISKLEYDVEGAQFILKRRSDDFVPRVEVMKTPAAASAVAVKIKSDLLKNLQLSLPQGYGPKGMANTPCTEFPSAVKCTNDVNAIFTQAFGLSDVKIGSASTKPAIMDILVNGTRLLAWNNIGHGNPSCIVEWNSDPIFSTDFNSSTNFSGVYDSVILLNSCNTCSGMLYLKNAIMQHHPRTYIAGIISLPVTRSEYVDVDFWNKTLLQGQTMGTALSDASAAHGLTGAFCLDGYNGMFAAVEAAKFTEDCIPFNPNQVQIVLISGSWRVFAGSLSMLDFGSLQANAQKAVNIIKHYNIDKQCFVGRPNAPMMYFTAAGKAPVGPFPGEDAIPFNTANVTAAYIGGSWKVVDGTNGLLDFGAKEAQAKIAVEVIKFYGFNQICFVGRPNAPMMYFRR